jgi:hypothetical protein
MLWRNNFFYSRAWFSNASDVCSPSRESKELDPFTLLGSIEDVITGCSKLGKISAFSSVVESLIWKRCKTLS